MGLKIGKLIQKYVNAWGKVVKGVEKFAQSPVGKSVIQVARSVATGTVCFPTSDVLEKLGKAGGFGRVLGAFSGFASKFLGRASDLLSQTGLSGLSGFLNKTSSSGELLGMVKQLLVSRSQTPSMDPATERMARQNIFQLVAHRHAELLREVA